MYFYNKACRLVWIGFWTALRGLRKTKIVFVISKFDYLIPYMFTNAILCRERVTGTRSFGWRVGWPGGGESHEWNSASDLQRYVTQFGTLSWIKLVFTATLHFRLIHIAHFHDFPQHCIHFNSPFFEYRFRLFYLSQWRFSESLTRQVLVPVTVSCMTSHVVRAWWMPIILNSITLKKHCVKHYSFS